jgi:hypothetical protein
MRRRWHIWARRVRGVLEQLKADPARQLECQIQGMRKLVQREPANLAASVTGMLVFAHPRCGLDLDASPVVWGRPREAAAVLQHFQLERRLSVNDQARLLRLIVAAQAPDWKHELNLHLA